MSSLSVYIETTIPSFLTARPSRDVLSLAKQDVTREWWNRRADFDLYTSELVLREAGQGDPEAAQRRIKLLEGIKELFLRQEVFSLADKLVHEKILPRKARLDAIHIAVSAFYGMDILLTWNCTHIANAEVQKDVRRFFERESFEMPVICTPLEFS